MTFDEFKQEIRSNILSHLPEDYATAEIYIGEITKSNDQKHDIMRIMKEGANVALNIYLEEFYSMYNMGYSMPAILDGIAKVCLREACEREELIPFDVYKKEDIKDKLYLVVLNREKNIDYLKGSVCKEIPGTDLTAAVKVMVFQKENGENGTFLVTEKMRNIWEMTDEQLFDMALQNTVQMFPVTLMSMREFVRTYTPNLLEGADGEMMKMIIDKRPLQEGNRLVAGEQYILSNEQKLGGASVMLYPGLLEKIAEETQDSFYLLPSSTHEWILMHKDARMSLEEIQDMVIAVNHTQVSPEEFLSDEVYFYDHQEKKMVMATEPEHTKELVSQFLERLPEEDVNGELDYEMEA